MPIEYTASDIEYVVAQYKNLIERLSRLGHDVMTSEPNWCGNRMENTIREECDIHVQFVNDVLDNIDDKINHS